MIVCSKAPNMDLSTDKIGPTSLPLANLIYEPERNSQMTFIIIIKMPNL